MGRVLPFIYSLLAHPLPRHCGYKLYENFTEWEYLLWILIFSHVGNYFWTNYFFTGELWNLPRVAIDACNHYTRSMAFFKKRSMASFSRTHRSHSRNKAVPSTGTSMVSTFKDIEYDWSSAMVF
nr:cycloeucalenol cycloisomerase [Ipomoea batatas]GMC77847.1 cycloeucalenol cycloisomerase [Ipomoea batatas]GME10576.1 cycloeucalenol cycloisomerase [Ipomoea batatas]